MAELKFDESGYWSQVKLDIIRDYAKAYTTILKAQQKFSFVYIDGFSGAGLHARKDGGEMVPGGPLNASGPGPKEFGGVRCQRTGNLIRLGTGKLIHRSLP